MIIKIYTKIKNKWCLSRIVYSDVFEVTNNYIYYEDGFIDAEKIKIHPLLRVVKVWEKPREERR